MNAHPSSFATAPGATSLATLDRQWLALHEQSGAVLGLASKNQRSATGAVVPPELRDFPEVLATLSGGRRQLAEEGLSDLLAILEPGLAALLRVRANGADTTVPARALWKEFVRARAGLVALAKARGA